MSDLPGVLIIGFVYFLQDLAQGDYSDALRAFPFAIPGLAILGVLIYGYIKHPVIYLKGTLGVAMGMLLVLSMWYFLFTFTEIHLLIRVAIALPVFFLLLSLIGKNLFPEEGKDDRKIK